MNKRRNRGFAPIGATAFALTRGLRRDRASTRADLAQHWPAIVGPELAATTQPLKLAYRGADRATLILGVAAGEAVALAHRTQEIRDRANGYLGKALIDRIALRPGHFSGPTRSAPPAPQIALPRSVTLADSLARLGRALNRERKQS